MKPFFSLRILAGIVTLFVLVAVVIGLYLAGSPGTQRDRQFDTQRIGHLEQISYATDSYFEIHRTLPLTLAVLTEDNAYLSTNLTDPVTEEPYEYRVISASTYELCATFALTSDESGGKFSGRKPAPYPITPAMRGEDWWHEAGRTCFSLEANVRALGANCGLLSPCPAEQTCAVLPGQTQAFCVPQGKECLAAGCANNQCVIAESYPVQVRCTQ